MQASDATGRENTSAALSRSEADLQLLSTPHVRAAQWINVALQHLTEDASMSSQAQSASSSSVLPGSEAVERLYVRVKAHEQNIASSTEDYIALSLSRLPRAAMELSQMVTEAERTASELHRLTEVVKPSAALRMDSSRGGENASCVPKSATSTSAAGLAQPQQQQQREKRMRELNALRMLHGKLKRCLDTLERASKVEDQIRRLDQGIHDFQERGKSKHFTSVLDLAESLETVQRDLTGLRTIDPHFGERHKAAIEQYEGFVETALEETCLRYLEAHDVDNARTLFRTLSAIGRADAVLASHVQKVTQKCVGELEQAFQKPADDSASSMRAEEAIAQLETTLLPSLLASVEAEADFLQRLAASADALASTATVAAGVANSDARDMKNAASSPSAAATTTTSPSPMSVSASKAREVLKSLLVHVSAKFEFAIKPILMARSTTNTQRIRMYDIVHQAVVKRQHVSDAQNVASASTAQHPHPHPQQHQQQHQLFTGQLLTSLVSVFHQPDVLSVFCNNLDASTALTGHDDGQESKRRSSSSQPTDAAAVWRGIDECVVTVEQLGAAVTTVTLDQVLRFFPDQLLPLCVPRWRQRFVEALAPVLVSGPEGGLPAAEVEVEPRESVQGELLAQLVTIEKDIKPQLERAKQKLEDQLHSPTLQQRYPAGVALTARTLEDQLWRPLLARVDERVDVCKSWQQRRLLEPVCRTTASYPSLPNWRIMLPLASAPSDVISTGDSAPSATGAGFDADHQRSHAAPTAPLRELGEAIMELPLALESLSSLDVLRLHSISSSAAAARSAASSSWKMSEIIEELASAWLDDLVKGSVTDFLVNKFGNVRVVITPEQSIDALTPSQHVRALQDITGAIQQLEADLDYLQNVLSAVTEEPFSELENALSSVQSMIPATEVKAFTIHDVISIPTSSHPII